MMSLSVMGAGRSGADYHLRDQARAAERDRGDRDYYTIDSSDQPGRWFALSSAVIRDGAEVDPGSWRDLAGGFDPMTGESLVKAAGDQHRSGWDLTFSSPKSFSLLRAQGNSEQRAMLDEMLDSAVKEALGVVKREELVSIRTGTDGHIQEAPKVVHFGLFHHSTSRSGDPQEHVHAALINVALRRDGKHGTLEPARLFRAQKMVGAAFRAALAHRLVKAGFAITAAGRDQFEVRGIRSEVLEQFSKRSQAIEAVVGNRGAASATEKEIAALASRSSKQELPDARELEERWRAEFKALNAERLWDRAQEAARLPAPEHETPQQRDELFEQAPAIAGTDPVAVAGSRLFQHENVLSRQELLEASFVDASLQGRDTAFVYSRIDELLSNNDLIELHDDEGQLYYTTPDIVRHEASLLRNIARPNERDWLSSSSIEAAIRQSSIPLAQEQQNAIRALASRSGVVVLNAGAGTGKTSGVAAPIAEAARADGFAIIGIGPTHLAKNELAAAGIEAVTAARFLHQMQAENAATLTGKQILLVDEASMLTTQQMAQLAYFAKASGTKLVLIGDTRQYESVGPGAALRLVDSVIGDSAKMTEVRRQQTDWQRAASTAMTTGDAAAGLAAYLQHGRVQLVDGPAEAQAAVIVKWSELRADHGEALIVTARNVDVQRLNILARERLRAEGRLTSPDISIAVRDRDGKTQTLPFAQGDRISFRENLPDLNLFNHDAGTILNVTSERLAVRLDDGRVIDRPLGNFSYQPPKRGRGRAPTMRPPRLEHGYASTGHSAQGATVPTAVVYVGSPTDARSTYVGLTRHRVDAAVVVESGRIETKIRDRLKRSGEDWRQPVSGEQISNYLLGEAARSPSKRNVSDFIQRDRTARFPPAGPDRRIATARRLYKVNRSPVLAVPAGIIARATQALSRARQLDQVTVASTNKRSTGSAWRVRRALARAITLGRRTIDRDAGPVHESEHSMGFDW